MNKDIADISIEDFIKNAFCISISEERKQLTTLIFQRVFGAVPHFYPGFTDSNSVKNCLMSHGAIVRMAKAMDLPFVTIFEDDAFPRPDAKVLLSCCKQNVPDDAALVTWGFSKIRTSVQQVNEHMFRLSSPENMWGGHAYTVFKAGYKKYLEIYTENYMQPPDQYWGIIGPSYLSTLTFIQVNYKPSSIRHKFAYPYMGFTPPSGFCNIHELLLNNKNKEEIHMNATTANPKVYALGGAWHENGVIDVVKKTCLDKLRVIEVGAYAGEISKVFASLPQVSEVWCVDYWAQHSNASDGMQDSTFPEVERRFDNVMSGSNGKIHKFKGKLSSFLNEHKGEAFDLIYLDGDHAYDTIMQQIDAACTADIRFLSGHDNAGWAPGVVQATKQLESHGMTVVGFGDTSWLVDTKLNGAVRTPTDRKVLLDLISYVKADNLHIVVIDDFFQEDASIFASSKNVKKVWCINRKNKSGYSGIDHALASACEVNSSEASNKISIVSGDDLQKFINDNCNKGDKGIDIVYIKGVSDYNEMIARINIARRLCSTFIAGSGYKSHTFNDIDVLRAVAFSFGGPDDIFIDGSWILDTRNQHSCSRTYTPFSIEDFFRNSFVMVRDHDEYLKFQEVMKHAGFKTMPREFIGVAGKMLNLKRYNSTVCTYNHYTLLKMAQTLDLPYITVFESDVWPIDNCVNELDELLSRGVPEDASEITFGSLRYIKDSKTFLTDSDGRFGRHLRGDIWGSQAVVYFKKGYDSIIKALEDGNAADHYSSFGGDIYATVVSLFSQLEITGIHKGHLVDPQNIGSLLPLDFLTK